MVTVYDTDWGISSVTRYIHYNVKKNLDLIMVNIGYYPGAQAYSESYPGIEFALSLKVDKPIILYYALDQSQFRDNPSFQLALSKDNFYYLDATDFSKIHDIVRQIEEGSPRVKNDALIASAERKIRIQAFSGALHGWESISNVEKIRRLKKLRSRFDDLNRLGDWELYDHMRDFILNHEGVFAGRSFSGIFCDLEGTLIKEMEIDKRLLAELRKKESEGVSITLWTGGDLGVFNSFLLDSGVDWPLFSKTDFNGAEVEDVIDDHPKELSSRYGIRYKRILAL